MGVLLQKLDIFLTRRDKLKIGFLVVLSLIISSMEVVGISSLMPFIAITSNPSLLATNKYFILISKYLNIVNVKQFIIIFGICLLVFYIARGCLNVFFLYWSNIFAGKKHSDIREQLIRCYTELFYQDFVKKNSGIMMKNVMTESGYIAQMIPVFLSMLSEFFVFIALYIILLLTDWKITIIASIVLGSLVLIISKSVKKSIIEFGDQKSLFAGNLAKMINETIGNLKIVKMTGNEELTVRKFSVDDRKLTTVVAKYSVLVGLPKFFLETIGFVGIVIIVIYVFNSYEDSAAVLPILAMFTLAFYRMLPSINKMLLGVNQIRFFKPSVNILYEELSYKSESLGGKKLPFQNEIELRNVFFSYEKSKIVLDDIDLKIDRGKKIAFVGESGSGKSTLVDLIMGMYQPDRGEIRVDGQLLTKDYIKSWRKNIGYIPQTIYLFDGTVAENVIFYRKPDEEKLVDVLKKANIYDFLLTKKGLDTNVGEGGIQLSGGQKQRIAIARALYSDPEILILDEATSSLDEETENKIMDEIYDLANERTLLVIAHRVATLKRCESIIRIDNGKVANELENI